MNDIKMAPGEFFHQSLIRYLMEGGASWGAVLDIALAMVREMLKSLDDATEAPISEFHNFTSKEEAITVTAKWLSFSAGELLDLLEWSAEEPDD